MGRPDLPDKVRKLIDNFTGGLKDIYREGLVSVILYGSAASGEFAGKHSNINLAVILSDASLPSIKKAAKLINMRRYSSINPIFFTEDYMQRSLDVFPIEFLDMKENHAVLYGKDALKDLRIDVKNLRFQCEQELKSKILNIKRLYLRAKSIFAVKDILFRSISPSLHILRNVVRLKGKAPSYQKEDVLNEISREFAVDIGGLKKILDAKRNKVKLGLRETEGLLESLISTLEEIGDKVDDL